MDKEFYNKYSKDFECSCCQDLEHCINGKEPLKINCAIHYFKDKIAELETKLAEKEKELAKWKNKKVKHLVDGLLVDRNLAIQIVEEIREDFRQKSFCNDYHEYIVDMEIFEYFNNKIKSLKGETDGSTN